MKNLIVIAFFVGAFLCIFIPCVLIQWVSRPLPLNRHRWFAWHPVLCWFVDGKLRYRWLCYVERQWTDPGTYFACWEYWGIERPNTLRAPLNPHTLQHLSDLTRAYNSAKALGDEQTMADARDALEREQVQWDPTRQH